MDEILGISRSGTTTPYPTTSIPETPSDSPAEDGVKLQELTTSSKSVMEYFKEKLKAKSNAAVSTTTPSKEEEEGYDDRPRAGLGLGASRAFGVGLWTRAQVDDMATSPGPDVVVAASDERQDVEGKEEAEVAAESVEKKKKRKEKKEKRKEVVNEEMKDVHRDEKKKRKREDVSSEATTRGAVEDAEPGTVQVEAKSKRKKDKGSKKRKVDDA